MDTIQILAALKNNRFIIYLKTSSIQLLAVLQKSAMLLFSQFRIHYSLTPVSMLQDAIQL